MPLYRFYTMVQKSQKWPKTQIRGGGGPALITALVAVLLAVHALVECVHRASKGHITLEHSQWLTDQEWEVCSAMKSVAEEPPSFDTFQWWCHHQSLDSIGAGEMLSQFLPEQQQQQRRQQTTTTTTTGATTKLRCSEVLGNENTIPVHEKFLKCVYLAIDTWIDNTARRFWHSEGLPHPPPPLLPF